MQSKLNKLRKEAKNDSIKGIIAVFIVCVAGLFVITVGLLLLNSLATAGAVGVWAGAMVMLLTAIIYLIDVFIKEATSAIDLSHKIVKNYESFYWLDTKITQKEAADKSYKRWIRQFNA